jgi:hypothetical protein
MVLKAAFLFVAPGADYRVHKTAMHTPEVVLTVVGVSDYDMAEKATEELIEDGIEAIELCGGFGDLGTAVVKRAARGRAVVGVVRFDIHPGLGCKSGDEIFVSTSSES